MFLLAAGSLFGPKWSDIASADAIVVSKAMTASTIAEIYVEEHGIRVELEIGAQDLASFLNLLPDEAYTKVTQEAVPLAKRLETFFEQDWVIRINESEPLPGRLGQLVARKRILRDEITGQPLPIQPDDVEKVLFVELAYAWSDRPKSVSLYPLVSADNRLPAANIGFVLYHRGVPVNDFRYLAAESTVDLDWDDPSAGEHALTSRAIDVDGNVQPAMDDPSIAGKKTYWEANGQITRRIEIA